MLKFPNMGIPKGNFIVRHTCQNSRLKKSVHGAPVSPIYAVIYKDRSIFSFNSNVKNICLVSPTRQNLLGIPSKPCLALSERFQGPPGESRQ